MKSSIILRTALGLVLLTLPACSWSIGGGSPEPRDVTVVTPPVDSGTTTTTTTYYTSP